MKIKEILSQNRRDFRAIYECEYCGFKEVGDGYDDDNFHKNVIPKMTCPRCKMGNHDSYRPLATKYGAHEAV